MILLGLVLVAMGVGLLLDIGSWPVLILAVGTVMLLCPRLGTGRKGLQWHWWCCGPGTVGVRHPGQRTLAPC